MIVVFRVDASSDVGFGHLSRCINLAEVLRSRGNEVSFICRDDELQSFRTLEDRLFATVLLPLLATGEVCNQQQDADQTIEALKEMSPDWLVVDNYRLDKQWEQMVRPYALKIAVIEDLPNRRHNCDLLLDQNFSDRSNDAFRGQVPDACELLLGPRFALISEEFKRIREIKTKPTNELKRIFVFCGGSDPQNLTQQVIDELSTAELSNIAIDVVIGAQNQNFNRDASRKLKENFEIHDAGSRFAQIMRRADLAIGAGGTTTWERICLGIPSVVVSIAENQNPACEKLGSEGLVNYLGAQASLRPGVIRDAVIEAKNSCASLFDQIERGQILVDGRGCERVAEVMCPSAESDLVVRLAKADDCVEFFNWVNDPAVREQSLTTSTIQWEDHKRWFAEKISSASCETYVLEASGLPVGQVRFDLIGDCAEIDYSLDKIVRGRGWSSTLLEKSIKAYCRRQATSLCAVVKRSNTLSRAVFFKIGFEESGSLVPPPTGQLSIAIISDEKSWINSYLRKFKLDLLRSGHRLIHVHNAEELIAADVCFYLSFSRVVSTEVLKKFKNNLVIHESDLPHGKGWSPLTWQILEGKDEITTVLFEASDQVDSGQVYLKSALKFDGSELV
ncbi:MAG: UDP-2,4-diacetamido-2,4,6-trideoxy-beta-L-altropyranose hydrolase, partial [Actinobacteria bacterium]|nr:UDP-2,4-diacetamido-2,4,6-trideoxy-beta-L-altropyranose hydrolase [Actinomycetota bacterium]